MANSEYTNYGGPRQQTSYGSPPPFGAANSGGYPPPARPPFPPPVRSSNNETVVAGIAHLSSFFAPLICPLIIWLVVRDSMPYASRQGKQAFFFHLIMSVLGTVVGLFLFFIFTTTFFAAASQAGAGNEGSSFAFPIWFFALFACIGLISLVGQGFSIYGAVQAFQGKDFSYPLLGRL